jgi:hypothetical protein
VPEGFHLDEASQKPGRVVTSVVGPHLGTRGPWFGVWLVEIAIGPHDVPPMPGAFSFEIL